MDSYDQIKGNRRRLAVSSTKYLSTSGKISSGNYSLANSQINGRYIDDRNDQLLLATGESSQPPDARRASNGTPFLNPDGLRNHKILIPSLLRQFRDYVRENAKWCEALRNMAGSAKQW